MTKLTTVGALAATILSVAATMVVSTTNKSLAQQQISVDMNRISNSGIGGKIGTVLVSEVKSGLSFKLTITGQPKGRRGFHVHQNGDCGPAMNDGKMSAGMAAGGHYDPDAKNSHRGPKGVGHKGDLPVVEGSDHGIDQTVIAPRMTMADVLGRTLILHEGGDNFTDNPENGGGKGRVACGVVPKQQ